MNSILSDVLIDFRTVNIDDVAAQRGAPNVNSEPTGTCVRDYPRGTDVAHVPEKLYLLYEPQPPVVRAPEFQPASSD